MADITPAAPAAPAPAEPTPEAKPKARAAARKVKDKWRAKEWYVLFAPDMFNRMQLGETPSIERQDVVGRTVEATVHDLTGDFSKMHIKLRFRIHELRGGEAHTVFVGHDLTSDYIRRLTRRKRTKTDTVVDVTTRDGWALRVKPMAVSEQRIQASQETAVRRIMAQVVQETAATSTLSEFVRGIIGGDLGKKISEASRPIVPIKKIEIRRSEVTAIGDLTAPQGEPIVAPVGEAAPASSEAEETAGAAPPAASPSAAPPPLPPEGESEVLPEAEEPSPPGPSDQT